MVTERIPVPELARAAPDARREDGRRPRPSIRLRILGWSALLLVGAMLAALTLQTVLLRAQLDTDVARALTADIDSLRQVVGERDPTSGTTTHASLVDALDVHLARQVTEPGDAAFTLLAGVPHASTVAPVQLLDDPALVSTWGAIRETTSGRSETSAGPVRWLAVPLLDGDGNVLGTYVAASFLAGRQAEIDTVARAGAVVFGTVIVIAIAIAWFLAGRTLRPIRLLTETARSIDHGDLSRRIPIRGSDELTELARTFNDMVDRLESAFITQRRFIDDAGHELWTPITIIRGHLELLGDDPDERVETRAIVIDELDRMSRMVDDLLTLARADQPDFIVTETVDAAALTDEIIKRADALGDRTWERDPVADGRIEVDRQRIIAAGLNLVRNALAHTPDDAVVGIGSRIRDGAFELWVRDDGPGIPIADQDRIFQRFARGAVGERGSDGTGLGLAITAAIADGHGGRVDLVSEVGHGSRFTIVVPVRPAAAGGVDDPGPA